MGTGAVVGDLLAVAEVGQLWGMAERDLGSGGRRRSGRQTCNNKGRGRGHPRHTCPGHTSCNWETARGDGGSGVPGEGCGVGIRDRETLGR
jgi:hypothetical protein